MMPAGWRAVMKKRVVVIGAGLCGSFLSAMLRNHFQVTVVEQSRKKRPLYEDVWHVPRAK